MLLLRHGATDANIAQPPVLQGRGMNLGLAPIGRRQAELTATFLSEIACDRWFASPLRRAQETAEVLRQAQANAAQRDIETLPSLTEVHVGRWEGRSLIEIQTNDTEAHAKFLQDAGRFGYADGETLSDVRDRVLPTFDSLLEENRGRRILVVAHNIVNRAFLCHVLGIPLANYRAVTQDNCGITVVERDAKATVVRSMNIVTHLAKL